MAASSTDKKLAEALEHVKEAEKNLKTGLLKWKPDYDSAAFYYNKAATAFRNAKNLEETKKCYLKAAEAHQNNRACFQAAKMLEQASMISRDQGDLMGCTRLIERASQMYMEQGTPDTAALCLDRGAKIVEQKYPEKAIEMFMKSADFAACEEKYRQAAEFMSRASRLNCKLKQYHKSADCIRTEIEMNTNVENFEMIYRLTVARVLVLLAAEDFTAADASYRDALNCPGFSDSDECANLGSLLEAYEKGDQDQMDECFRQPHIKFMDNEYAKLARVIQTPHSAPVKQPSTWEQANRTVDDDEPDEYADGLC